MEVSFADAATRVLHQREQVTGVLEVKPVRQTRDFSTMLPQQFVLLALGVGKRAERYDDADLTSAVRELYGVLHQVEKDLSVADPVGVNFLGDLVQDVKSDLEIGAEGLRLVRSNEVPHKLVEVVLQFHKLQQELVHLMLYA